MLKVESTVFMFLIALVGCQEGTNNLSYQVIGGNEAAAEIDLIEIKKITRGADSSVNVTFEISNNQPEDICIIRGILNDEFSIFADLQAQLATGRVLTFHTNGLAPTNYDTVTLEPGAKQQNTLAFGAFEGFVPRKKTYKNYRITIAGLYCASMTDDYYPIDFIMQSEWFSFKSASQ